MTVPTQGEEFSKFIHHISEAQSTAYTLSHLARSMSSNSKDRALADGWFSVGELLKRLNHQVTELAKGKLQ